MSNDLVRKQVGTPNPPYYGNQEEFDVPEIPQGIPPPGYGYAMNMRPTGAANNVQHVQQYSQKNNQTPTGFSTYPIFKDVASKPSPSSNGDIKEAEYEKFINWFVNAHLGKTWVLVDFILVDGRKIQGSIMNIVNLSYRTNPKPSEMGIEIILNDKLFKGFICIPLTNIQLEKATVANSQYTW